MNPGIYHVAFEAAGGGNFGEAIVVIRDGKINGGDVGYFYTGSVEGPENDLTAKLKVKRWNSATSNPLIPANEYTLDLKGSATADFNTFTVSGIAMGTRISAKGKKLADAV